MLVSTFLVICFVLYDRVFFQHYCFFRSHSKQEHLWCLLKAGNCQEVAPSCPRRWLPWYPMLTVILNFVQWQWIVWHHWIDCHLFSGIWYVPNFHLLWQCSSESCHIDLHNVWKMCAKVVNILEIFMSCTPLTIKIMN